MIVIDTNVVSEIVKLLPAPAVIDWFASQNPQDLYTTTITQAEILYGIELLPKGRRRSALETAISTIFEQMFAARVLPFDEGSAYAFAMIAARHRASGRTIGEFDSQIAAIAFSRGASLATRNIADFWGCGVTLINPWDSGE
jgi:predicted nucleic acid-binding protein